ncbi:carbon storage regulator [Aeoliella sp. ICT_H6.2]|uniref:Translational regulator CsrA n=1 Tax=Aeoliella straminimaris TaxID=2954799 RepID=A0A9X2FBD7_9BACT|nr:carbon storage regulator [Aeoliella straminimaris]MCO6045414.1 carbon storage regulator [Aeoliella straminimaris]
MLVLTRKSDEKIRIGDDIVITVLRTKGKAVRLGIEAPSDMRVLRGEIAFDGDDAADSHRVAEQAEAKPLHARVPRSQVASVIPALVAEGGPLAEFLNTASVVAR